MPYDLRQQHRGLEYIIAKSGEGAIAGEIVRSATYRCSSKGLIRMRTCFMAGTHPSVLFNFYVKCHFKGSVPRIARI